MTDENLIYRQEAYEIFGACMEVHNEQGTGFVEPVYQECLELEFSLRKIPFEAQVPLHLSYKGTKLRNSYIPDFICYNKIIVEIKAVRALLPEHSAQLMNYLRATNMHYSLTSQATQNSNTNESPFQSNKIRVHSRHSRL